MCLVIAVLVIIPYAQVAWHEFLLCDDNDYITTVPIVKEGLTWEGVKWAFNAPHASNWHPLTWLSHMLDCQLFGLNPGPHHLVSVGFHTATAVLLFLTVRMMTGSLWRSAAVAALFALHPLRVESVAWVAERKDVLSGFFWMLTLLSYAWYARRPGIWRYAAVFAALALGLLCKSMAVTMPFLLLLLDVWPLRRGAVPGISTAGLRKAEPCPPRSWGRLVLEKVPLLVLAIVISKVAIAAQGGYGSITGTEDLTMQMRVANALVSCVAYLSNMVWPLNLGLFYPHPATVSQNLKQDLYLPAVVAGAILVCITFLVIWQRKTRPWLIIGWLWYLGTLVPVIGIVQIGAQARADRYTYLTMIGITIAIVWSIGELVARKPLTLPTVKWAASVVVIAYVVLTWIQVGHWRTDFTIFEHSARVIPKNYFAYNQLGAAYREKGDRKKAEENFAKSLEFNADYDFGNNNLGVALMERGALDEARKAFQRAVKVNNQFVPPLRNLALLFFAQGQPTEAAAYCEQALRLQPGNASAQAQLATIYEQMGRFDDAERRYLYSLSIDPYDTRTSRFLGVFYANRNRLADSAKWLMHTVQVNPADADAWNALGVVFAQQGDKVKGIACIERALSIVPNHPEALNNMKTLRAQPPEAERAR
jgi:protein O-mannosyl-transferase